MQPDGRMFRRGKSLAPAAWVVHKAHNALLVNKNGPGLNRASHTDKHTPTPPIAPQ